MVLRLSLNGAPLSDSRRPRVDPTRATLVGGECSLI